MDTTKPPRQMAADILALPSRAEQVAALNNVPAHLRELVRTHLNNAIARRRAQ